MELVEVKLVVEKSVLGRELSYHNPFFEGRQERIPSRWECCLCLILELGDKIYAHGQILIRNYLGFLLGQWAQRLLCNSKRFFYLAPQLSNFNLIRVPRLMLIKCKGSTQKNSQPQSQPGFPFIVAIVLPGRKVLNLVAGHGGRCVWDMMKIYIIISWILFPFQCPKTWVWAYGRWCMTRW